LPIGYAFSAVPLADDGPPLRFSNANCKDIPRAHCINPRGDEGFWVKFLS
jgi:hypothetical protein